ncbi:hypothetical protein BBF96_08545 [Anoxybacter fermentans]|uniref:DUF72 domain-containing protein n=1 Tax=Anoxybacter fermentans TaxID=1323375 RepID=A0A3Q9HQM4_9FIRM|nr:DUF72 domain-containing protein [Anoxybacter fermentans]AZR73426.1 hypothetical protein BBF96_08545 [Anoxybacter fermentans]
MIIIGTSGYSYNDWVGPVYPEGIDKKDLLSYYAREFKMTEINFTYYQMPNKFIFYHMQKKTPDDFIFIIKAHQSMTHKIGRDIPFKEFMEACEPLIEANKFGGILAQFPSRFRNEQKNREYLARLRDHIPDYPIFVEFRHNSWMKEPVFEFLSRLNLSFVSVDEPQLPELLPPVFKATTDLGYIRFHGRNAEKWWKHDHAYERYNYLYSLKELGEWVKKIQALEKQLTRVYISMNNHFQGKAVVNARQLAVMLKGE